MAREPYTVKVFGKDVEISTASVSPQDGLALVYKATYTGTSKPVPQSRNVTGYGETAREAVVDMLKAARTCKGGTELL